MSKKEIKYEEYSQDNQEIEYNQNSQDEFNQDCDYGEEGEGRNDLLALAESLGEVVGIDNPELLLKTIIKAMKSGKSEKIKGVKDYVIIFKEKMKVIEVHQREVIGVGAKERVINYYAVGMIPLSRNVINQLRQYC